MTKICQSSDLQQVNNVINTLLLFKASSVKQKRSCYRIGSDVDILRRGGVAVLQRAVRLGLRRWTRRFNSRPFLLKVTTLGKLITYMCLFHRAVLLPVKRRLCPMDGKVTAGLASHVLVMRHGLQWFIHLRADGLR